MKKLLRVLLVLILLLGIVGFVGIQFVRSQIDQRASQIVSGLVDSNVVGDTLQDLVIPPTSPQEFVQYFNNHAQEVSALTNGLVSSASASVQGSHVTYDFVIDGLNGLVVDVLIASNGDQIEAMANAILDSMVEAGTQNPSLDLNLVNEHGQIIRTLHYTR